MVAVSLGWIAALLVSTADVGGPSEPEIKEAAVRALKLIEHSTKTYPKHRTCFSCHHQAVPVLALSRARTKGIAVDAENLTVQRDLTSDDLESALEEYKAGKGQPGGVTRAGYALLTLAEAGSKPDEITNAVTSFLVGRDKDKGYWITSSKRPPTEVSSFTSTYVALLGLKNFAATSDEKVKARFAAAKSWLEKTEAKDTEDRVFRLLGLRLTAGDPAAIEATVAKLKATQRLDGGWAQLDDGQSDAYATGSALSALRSSGNLSADDASFRKGLAFLIKTQKPDGSWHVVSRSKPFQPYFESGFPHVKDQFISIAASSWAAIALLSALPDAPPDKPMPKVEPLPAKLGFNPYYRKYVDFRGLPIISSERTSDYALLEAAHLVERMIGDRPDIQAMIVKNKLRLVVMAYSERTTDLPEQRDMKPKDFWDVRARGLGASRSNPVVSCGEENLLSYKGDPYRGENILIHEFAHAIHGMALRDLDKTFDGRLKEAHESALAKGLWSGTYAGSNAGEYWAEAVQSWFDCNLNPPDFQHNEIDTREELKKYDPKVAALVAEVFGDKPWRYVVPAKRTDLANSPIAGFDPEKAPVFSWGKAQKKYDEVVAEKKQKRAEESAKQGKSR